MVTSYDKPCKESQSHLLNKFLNLISRVKASMAERTEGLGTLQGGDVTLKQVPATSQGSSLTVWVECRTTNMK